MNNIQDKKYFGDISEAIKVYEELRKYKNGDFIETIDPDFFFNLTDCIIKEYAKQKQENEELKKYKQIYLDEVDKTTDTALLYNDLLNRVKNKIEDLKRQRRELVFKTYLRKEDIINDDRKIVCQIQVLEELLEDK